MLLLGMEELAVVAKLCFAGWDGGGQMTVGSPFPLTDAQSDGIS